MIEWLGVSGICIRGFGWLAVFGKSSEQPYDEEAKSILIGWRTPSPTMYIHLTGFASGLRSAHLWPMRVHNIQFRY